MITNPTPGPDPGRHSHPVQVLLNRLLLRPPSLSYLMLVIGIALSPFNVLRVRGSIIVSDVFLIAAGVLLLTDLAAGRTRLWAPKALLASATVTICGFLGFTLSNLGAYSHLTDVHFVVLFFNCFVVPVMIASQRITAPAQVERLVFVWLSATVIAALVVLLQVQGAPLPGFVKARLVSSAGRYAGLTMHPNAIGFFSSLAFPVALAMLLAAQRWTAATAWLLASALLAYAMNQSGSRTAMGSALIAGALLIALFVKLRPRTRGLRSGMVTLLGAAMILAALSISGTESALGRLFGSAESAPLANVEREKLNSQLLAEFERAPVFGNGYQLSGIHNVLYGTLGITGATGLLALLLREWAFAAGSLHLLSRLRSHVGRFDLAAGLTLVYPVWVLACLKNFVVLERVGFIALGLMLLYSLHGTRVAPRPVPGLG